MGPGHLHDVFEDQGFVDLPGFFDAADIERLRCGIEDAATRVADDNPLSLGAMRFASNLYRESDDIVDVVTSERVVELLTAIGGPDQWLRWDQAVWKLGGAPEFPWHQDNGYTGLAATHLQLWIALTPMRPENGGLLVCPGGHHRRLEHRDVGHHVETDPPGPELAISADAGDVILFSSFLPHATAPNRSGELRLAYVAEYLPLGVDDVSVQTPRLVVAEGGVSSPRWIDG
jgi:ectoine hydroxylase-related dioxygenase (phytanoyl-CoA dioxygenase family)